MTHYYEISHRLYLYLTSFSINILFLLQDAIQGSTLFRCHVSPFSSDLSLFFLTLAVLRGIDQVSCRRSLNSGLYDIFLIIRQDCVGLWKEYHRSELLLSSHISGNMWYPHDIIGDMNLRHLGNMVFARFFYWRITIFLFFPSILWK